MARADNTRYLVLAAQQRHDQAIARATKALRDLERARKPVTFRTVADAAAVSRGWLYRNAALRDAINARRSAHPSPRRRAVPASQRASTESLKRRIDALREEVTDLRGENGELRQRIARLHGERRATQPRASNPSPVTYVGDMSPTQTP